MVSSNIEVGMVSTDRRMVGYSSRHGQTVITTPVVDFDEETMVAKTRSGSIYQVALVDGVDKLELLEKLRNDETTVS